MSREQIRKMFSLMNEEERNVARVLLKVIKSDMDRCIRFGSETPQSLIQAYLNILLEVEEVKEIKKEMKNERY